MHVIPRLIELIAPQTVHDWHLAALDVLERVGMSVPDADLARRLADCGELRVQQGRVYMPPHVVQRELEAVCRPALRPAPAPLGTRITLNVGLHAHHYLDPHTDQLRPFTTRDLITATRLVDAMHAEDVVGSAPGVPQDVPREIQGLTQLRVGYLHSRHGGVVSNAGSPQQARWYCRMARAAGRPHTVSCHLVSPLRLAGNELTVALALQDEDVHIGVSTMPMMGATAPQSFAGAAIQGMAEVLGGFTALRLLGLQHVSFGFNLYAFDHRDAVIVYGSPEQNLCDAVQMAVNRYYHGAQSGTRSIRSMSKAVDAQSCAERAASAVFGALLGSRVFNGAGLLSLDEVFSPLQLVLDREIADYAGRLAQGISLEETAGCVELIAQGALRGTYLDHDHTAARFRQECWSPRLFQRAMLQAWRLTGSPTALARARERVSALTEADSYVCPPDMAQAVEQVYQEGCRDLLGM